MIVIMTAKRLEAICRDIYQRAVTRGYELGYRAGQASQKNRGCIIGSRLDKEIEEILRKQGG